MNDPALFTWRHFEADIILCAVQWYLCYVLSERYVEELLRERGAWIDHIGIRSFQGTLTTACGTWGCGC